MDGRRKKWEDGKGRMKVCPGPEKEKVGKGRKR